MKQIATDKSAGLAHFVGHGWRRRARLFRRACLVALGSHISSASGWLCFRTFRSLGTVTVTGLAHFAGHARKSIETSIESLSKVYRKPIESRSESLSKLLSNIYIWICMDSHGASNFKESPVDDNALDTSLFFLHRFAIAMSQKPRLNS